jgi:hypothetical protein
MLMNLNRALFNIFFVLSVVLSAFANAQSVDWIRQPVGAGDNRGIVADALGNVFVSFQTTQGAALSRYGASGDLSWTRYFGTPEGTENSGLAVDGFGNVYISGNTFGNLSAANAGDTDVFLRKYNSTGTLQWSQQFGTSGLDFGSSVSTDGEGNVYVSGGALGTLSGAIGSGSVFTRKYKGDGTPLWTTQFGDVGREDKPPTQITADKLGNLYGASTALGLTQNQLDDVSVFKLDSSGTVVWKHLLGIYSDNWAGGAATDGKGNLYISGTAFKTSGHAQSFVSKYDSEGNQLWSTLISDPYQEIENTLAADEQGNVYLAGTTYHIAGGTGYFDEDAFVSKLDPSGNLLWTHGFSTPTEDEAYGVSDDEHGSIYVSGNSAGSFGGQNVGALATFFAKISDVEVPEPAIFSLAATSVSCLLMWARRRSV